MAQAAHATVRVRGACTVMGLRASAKGEVGGREGAQRTLRSRRMMGEMLDGRRLFGEYLHAGTAVP
jgi:hypothetical protein